MRSFPRASASARLAALAAAAGLLRLAYGLRFPAAVPNTDSYADIAAAFARTGALAHLDGTLTADREPLYPLLLGTAFRLFGEGYRVTLVLNCLLGALVVWALWRAAREVFDERVAWTAALVAASYPQFIYYCAQPVRETLMVLLGVVSVWALWRASKAGDLAAAAAGAAAALAALTSTQFLVFSAAGAPAALLWLGRAQPRRAARTTAVFLAAFVALYGLWPLRNYRAFGTWVLGSTAAAGGVFYIYQLVPQELGGTPAESEIIANDPVWQASGAIKDPVRRQQYFWREGWKLVRARPAHFARLFAWRLLWDQWRPTPRERAYSHSYRLLWWASLLTDGWIIPLGFSALLFFRLRPDALAVIPLYLVSLGVVTAPLLTIMRYRLPSMPWLILGAAALLVALRDRLRAAKA